MIELLLVSAVATLVAVICLFNWVIKLNIDVQAMKNSTHSIQYVPIDKTSGFESLDDDQKEKLKTSMGMDGDLVNM
jgi:hypothetical protein